MTDAYEQDESDPSDANESDATGGRASLVATGGMLGLYLFGAAGLLSNRLDALAAGDPQTIGVALLLLAPLVAFGALCARRR